MSSKKDLLLAKIDKDKHSTRQCFETITILVFCLLYTGDIPMPPDSTIAMFADYNAVLSIANTTEQPTEEMSKPYNQLDQEMVHKV